MAARLPRVGRAAAPRRGVALLAALLALLVGLASAVRVPHLAQPTAQLRAGARELSWSLFGGKGAAATPAALAEEEHQRARDKLVTEEFKQLEAAEAVAEQAIQAAEAAGDMEEAQLQQEALEQLEEKVVEVAAAEESEAAHAQAAEDALAAGDVATAEAEHALAAEAQAEAEAAEQELADAVLAEQEIAEMSLRERLDPSLVVDAVTNYGPKAMRGAAAAAAAARGGLRTRLDRVLGRYPLLATFIEWLSLVAPVALLMAGFALLRRDSTRTFSLRSEVLLFCHMYMAGYYGLLAATTAVLPEAPLVAFARAQPEQYVAYQVLLLLLFMAYLVLLICHVVVERTPTAGLQLLGAVVVYIHSYFTVFHRAMHSALPPQSSAAWFALYSAIFASMTFLIKTERKGKGD